MMTLSEAIQHAEEKAADKDCCCRAEHAQLAEWLKELQLRRLPKVGDVFRHFKGGYYVIVGYVHDATNGADTTAKILYTPQETLYQIDRNYFCRNIKEFLSPVDKTKYPDATQSFRFEKVIYHEIGDDYPIGAFEE